MYMLVVVLLFTGGRYEEFVSTPQSQAECEAHLPEMREAAEERTAKDRQVVGYWMACSLMKGRET